MGRGQQEFHPGSCAVVLWGRGRSQGRKRTGLGHRTPAWACWPEGRSWLSRRPEAPCELAPRRMAWQEACHPQELPLLRGWAPGRRWDSAEWRRVGDGGSRQMRAGLAEVGVCAGPGRPNGSSPGGRDLLLQQQKPVVEEVLGAFGEGQAQNATRGRMRKSRDQTTGALGYQAERAMGSQSKGWAGRPGVQRSPLE